MERAKRMAVLVGCNYPNTKNELHGCINDVLAMKQVLVDRFGFANIQVLTDDDHQDPSVDPERLTLPTGSNIKRALHEMVDAAEEGDVMFFHYSGHGTRIPSLNPAHVLRQDEAIVPCDFNLITDADFRQLVNKLPKGATFTMLSDSCHSGGLIDKEKEQIGPSTVFLAPKSLDDVSIALKTISFQAILKHLASLTNIHTSDVGTHLLELFGSEASLVFKQHPVSSLSEDNDEGILLSGCQANETSADINPASSTMASGGEKAYGAFSNAIQKVLKENPGALSNKEVVVRARQVLKEQGFVNQHPCLYCSDENACAAFLSQ